MLGARWMVLEWPYDIQPIDIVDQVDSTSQTLLAPKRINYSSSILNSCTCFLVLSTIFHT